MVRHAPRDQLGNQAFDLGDFAQCVRRRSVVRPGLEDEAFLTPVLRIQTDDLVQDDPVRSEQSALRIAYIGPARGSCLQRAEALERLGHVVTWIDPYDWIGRSVWMARWLYRTGGLGIGLKINRPIFNAVKRSAPDLIWVDQGQFLGAALIAKLRTLSVPIVNYTIDDPFGGRDGRRFNNYFGALPFYDLLAVVREENVAEAYARGARNVLRVWMSADEIAHRPRVLTDEDARKYASEVCFVGTWFPERGPFMAELVRAGLPLSIGATAGRGAGMAGARAALARARPARSRNLRADHPMRQDLARAGE